MKRITLIDLAIVLAVGATMVPSHAKGSSHPQSGDQTGTGMIPWSTAQRVVTWSSERHWQTADGQILVCPWDAKTYSDKVCIDKKNDKVDRWIPLTSYSVPGFEIVGFQYFYADSYGSQQRAVYYGAVKPKVPVVAGVVNDADAEAVKRSLNLSGMSATVGTITIKADKVIVQRKKP